MNLTNVDTVKEKRSEIPDKNVINYVHISRFVNTKRENEALFKMHYVYLKTFEL